MAPCRPEAQEPATAHADGGRDNLANGLEWQITSDQHVTAQERHELASLVAKPEAPTAKEPVAAPAASDEHLFKNAKVGDWVEYKYPSLRKATLTGRMK